MVALWGYIVNGEEARRRCFYGIFGGGVLRFLGLVGDRFMWIGWEEHG